MLIQARLSRKKIRIDADDTSYDAYRKIIEVEKDLIRDHIGSIINGNFTLSKPINDGNYNGIKDYKALCELDLSNIDTLENHINLLRALSHGDYKNAYFVDDNGKKVYLKIDFFNNRASDAVFD